MSEKELKEIGDWRLEAQTQESGLPTQQLVSVSMAAPDISPQQFLAQAQGKPRFFWQDASIEIGHSAATVAGFGIAANLTAWGSNRFQAIQQQAQSLFANACLTNSDQPEAMPRLFGGFSFRDDFAPDNTWSIYHPAQFILPHFQLVVTANGRWLTINALLSEEESGASAISALQVALENQVAFLQAQACDFNHTAVAAPPQIRYPMPFAVWAEMIQTAVQQMKTTALNKVVLARICEVKFNQNINIDQTLAALRRTYPDCYCFLFEPRPGHAFMGATPELLARLNGRSLTSMALAGSAPRGSTEAAAKKFGQALRHSAKDQHEHRLVVDALKRRLTPLTDRLSLPDQPELLQLSNIQHLHTPVSGTLKSGDGILPLIEKLHPTPALGGSPRPLAMQFIRQAEPVPRGWYAAPIGTISCNLDGAFGVAIRSAAVQDRRAWLYAGAGIVTDSEAQKEWDEAELKFTPMKNALGII